MTRTTYEVWPAKGDKPLLTFESRRDAVQYVTDRITIVPGLLIFEAVTTIIRREIGAERKAA